MDLREQKKILTFLNQNPLCVLSTNTDSGAPESALVAFAETPNFEIIFQTLDIARKYTNLMSDQRISLVAGWNAEKAQQITFQYEGTARELDKDNPAYAKYRLIFEQKDTPCTSEFLNNPNSRIFVVSPTWLRYSDYSGNKAKIIEQDFN